MLTITRCLDITIQLDHEIVAGTLAARFTSMPKQLIESGEGLK